MFVVDKKRALATTGRNDAQVVGKTHKGGHTPTQQERCEKPNSIQGPKRETKGKGNNHKQDHKMNVRCDQPKSPEQEGKKERVEEVAREGKERERRVSARAAAGGRTRLIGRRAFFCFKKRWLASREHSSVTNDILCNGVLRDNEYPG